MNALGTVPGHNDVINVHELRQIVRGLKSKKAVGNDGIPCEVYKFASERLLTIMSIFLSRWMLSGSDMAVFSLRQTVYFYHNQVTPVYMCFLDSKKGI